MLAAVALIRVALGIATLLALVPIELALSLQALALALRRPCDRYVRATEMEAGRAGGSASTKRRASHPVCPRFP